MFSCLVEGVLGFHNTVCLQKIWIIFTYSILLSQCSFVVALYQPKLQSEYRL